MARNGAESAKDAVRRHGHDVLVEVLDDLAAMSPAVGGVVVPVDQVGQLAHDHFSSSGGGL